MGCGLIITPTVLQKQKDSFSGAMEAMCMNYQAFPKTGDTGIGLFTTPAET